MFEKHVFHRTSLGRAWFSVNSLINDHALLILWLSGQISANLETLADMRWKKLKLGYSEKWEAMLAQAQ